MVRTTACQFGHGGKIRYRNSCGIGRDHSLDSHAQHDQQNRSAESNRSLQNQTRGKQPESVRALDVAPPASQRNIKGRSDCNQGNQNRCRQP